MSPALEKPLQVILNKRGADDRWRLEKSLNGQMWIDVEVKGQPSKWITLFALTVLDHFAGSSGSSIENQKEKLHPNIFPVYMNLSNLQRLKTLTGTRTANSLILVVWINHNP